MRAVLWVGRPRALPPRRPALDPWGENAASLPGDLRDQLAALGTESGAVREAVAGAIDDYSDLRDLLLGPGGTGSPVDDMALLAEAEVTLRSLIGRASAVAALVAMAEKRRSDRAGREAIGDAMLHLRDQARALRQAASAAVRWAASRGPKDAERLHACAGHLQQVTARAEGGSG